MDINYKGSLQDYCQRQRLPLPKYEVLEHSGSSNSPRFQVGVEVDGKWFVGKNLCFKKKEAEQSAAQVVYEALNPTKPNLTLTQSYPQAAPIHSTSQFPRPPPSYSSLLMSNSRKHMPLRYADSERFIINVVSSEGGRIRKIWEPDVQEKYQFEITGTYRYCENVGRHHRKNHIYFIVDPVRKTYCQKCHDPECFDFQSTIKTMSTNEEYAPVKRKSIPSANDSIFVMRYRHAIE